MPACWQLLNLCWIGIPNAFSKTACNPHRTSANPSRDTAPNHQGFSLIMIRPSDESQGSDGFISSLTHGLFAKIRTGRKDFQSAAVTLFPAYSGLHKLPQSS